MRFFWKRQPIKELRLVCNDLGRSPTDKEPLEYGSLRP